MTYWRRIGIALVVAFVAFAFIGIWMVAEDREQARSFDVIETGMTRAEIESVMGTPDAEAQGCPWLGGAIQATGCAVELQYKQNFGPVFFSVGFDEAGLAIAKYPYVSP